MTEANLAQVVAMLRAAQEERWRAGERVPAEAYLALHPALAHDVEKALELVYGEFLLREALGPTPSLDDYLRRFPAYASRLKQQVQLHQALADEPWSNLPATVSAPTAAAGALAVPAPMPKLAGYDLVRELGRGGMGVVYEAYDRKRRHAVALKTMQRVGPAALYRFKAEFRTLAGLTHRNLVTLYELVAEEGLWFYTMELLAGTSFLAHVRPASARAGSANSGALQLDRLRDTLSQLAVGLQALHDAGKLHRDIKPGNVLVTPQGRVVLLDFGLVAELDRSGEHLSHQPRLLGTAAYMAPEQAACRPVSPASDWYAFGSMLFEALTGRLPFDGTPTEIMTRKQDLDGPDPAGLVPGIPDELCAFCAELLRRNPRQRPSGQDVLRRLGAARVTGTPAPTSVPLAGRARHLETLGAAFQTCRQRRAVPLYVHGSAGVGKTALVRHFLDGLKQRGAAVVLTGRCREQESVPYKALDGLVDSLSRYLESLSLVEALALLPREIGVLAQVFPVLRRLEAVTRAAGRDGPVGNAGENRGLAALQELLRRLAGRRPVVLFIDDLQWGDRDSAAFLLELLRPADPVPMLMVGCYRSEDAASSPCLRVLLAAPESGGSMELLPLPHHV
jgi:hypothetical protein